MLADPQVITINSVPISFAKVAMVDFRGVYQNDVATHKLTISHQTSKKRVRRMARLDVKAVVTDPLTAVNDYETASIYIVIDEPEVGFSDAELGNIAAGFKAWLDATMVTKILSGQS